MDPLPLELKNLSASYDKRPALIDISLGIQSGSLVGVIGPNGAGKSTLIKAILGLIPEVSGEISVFGKSLKKNLKRVGYIPQRESIDWDFPVNVWDVVMMGRYNRLGIFERPQKADNEAVWKCLEKVNLTELYDRQISELSGGQQQRVFLARALAQESDLYLMDEPFSGVDAATEAAIIEVLIELKHKNKTLIVVHHDLTTAAEYFDHTLLLNKKLIQFGKTTNIFTFENLQTTYEGKLNIFRASGKTLISEANPERT